MRTFPMKYMFIFRLLVLVMVVTLLVACGKNDTTEEKTSGIAFRLAWPAAKVVASTLPVEVVTVRMSVSAPDMTTISKDFPAAARTGTVDNIPVGSGRIITFQGLDGTGTIKYEAVKYAVTLEAGVTFDCGVVTMDNTVPTAPDLLSASATSFGQVNLSWHDNAATETGYRIERAGTPGGTYALLATVQANSTAYSDTTVLPQTTYYYRVIAMNGIGFSLTSNEATATTPEKTYVISGAVTSGGVPVAGVAMTLTGTSTGSATTDSAGAYAISGVKNGTYTLTPVLTGYSFTQSAGSLTVANGNVTQNFSATASTVPATPTGLTATAVSASQITVTWQDNATNEVNYRIERKTGAGGSYALLTTVSANTSTYSDAAALTPATTYYYRVVASNALGSSSYSNEASATTNALATAITPQLVKVTGGSYLMGGTTQTSVANFYISAFEITQGEWQTVMTTNPASFSSCGLNCPVENVSWNDVQTFITTLNQLSGKTYRLPTEAEWEYAARSGGLVQTYSGGENVDAVAWYNGNSGSITHAVGGRQANGLGIYDMSGNVMEWLANDGSGTVINGFTCSSGSRLMRGGAYSGPAATQQTTTRACLLGNQKSSALGFRLVSDTP